MDKKCIENQQYSSSILYFMQADQTIWLEKIVQMFLEDYVSTGMID